MIAKLKQHLVKLLIGLIVILAAIYHLSFYVLPSISVENNSGVTITTAHVYLPASRLDYGSLAPNQKNTLHYMLKQPDGQYGFIFMLSNDALLEGTCGYVTNNEVHKRVTITVFKNRVVCK